MEYSGRTTAFEHKFPDWKERSLEGVKEAIQQKTVFEVQWSKCPVEVAEEVSELWRDQEYPNDYAFFEWKHDEHGSDYPIIDQYLLSQGVKECWIRYWW